MITVEILAIMLMALLARFLIPKMMEAESANLRFGIGMVLMVFYSVAMLLGVRYLCTVDGRTIAQLTGAEVWSRVVCIVLLLHAVVAFTAAVFFFTREKRKMREQDKVKLKDL